MSSAIDMEERAKARIEAEVQNLLDPDAFQLSEGNEKVLLRQKSYIDELEMDVDEEQELKEKKEKLWKLLCTYLPCDVLSLQKSIVQHVEYTLARRRYKRDKCSFYQATAISVRDRLIERWTDTQQYLSSKDSKRVYYLSLEYLLGRNLQNAMSCLALRNRYAAALEELGYSLEELTEEERDPGLGSGGLGRLASCFLDSLATLNFGAWGYGLRYKFGLFEQRLISKAQAEFPDFWLKEGYPWEVERPDVQYLVRMYGEVEDRVDPETGEVKVAWKGGEDVLAEGFDIPVPGFHTLNTNNLRLWTSKASCEFDLGSFNDGQYYAAIEEKERSEPLTSVLYPCDNNAPGKELRLRQQYFFVSATLQDILRRYKKSPSHGLLDLPNKVAIQLNETHPAIAIPELMRLLLDDENLCWQDAWHIVHNTCAYTNHTVMPEALEIWPLPLVEQILPRHLRIIYEINHQFLSEVRRRWPGDPQRVARMSIIEESEPKMVKMAHLAIIGCHKVNGVAQVHTGLLCKSLFRDFYEMWPEKFVNITNGVNHRRWMLQANPAMSAVISKWLGTHDWVHDLGRLERLKELSSNPEFQRDWQEMKRYNKRKLAEFIERTCDVDVDADAMFDVHVKRIHEYKRQFMNILGVAYRYLRILSLLAEEKFDELRQVVPKVVIFAGKAAPNYSVAKDVIKLIIAIADTINSDTRIGGLLKVVFIPNYNVSVAEVIIPGSDLSQHISTAGFEASGTSNMKFCMNGSLLLGSRDGANLEIEQSVGRANIFMFGANTKEVRTLQTTMQYRKPQLDGRLAHVTQEIRSGRFGPTSFDSLVDSLLPENDRYMVGHDFGSYLEALEVSDAAFRKPEEWTAKTIVSCASMSRFSSDRCIREYAEKIWNVEPHQFRPPNKNTSSSSNNNNP
ncbi:starch phosphorylase [Chloropicon primus]|uniref:Alpha-1,4 glucan phosphorylase n=1 Tax=Chloropicon primus TaxID=1764295 RepID=A0A5B8MU39_9CHLO|nr:starch phosphorylase [Chloropicon primus]UPR02486.1 starch phosphorylase [Chloropicon primus]|eukprot:QDZ23274.1 starch phosphorylase [Chloropicon primus]